MVALQRRGSLRRRDPGPVRDLYDEVPDRYRAGSVLLEVLDVAIVEQALEFPEVTGKCAVIERARLDLLELGAPRPLFRLAN